MTPYEIQIINTLTSLKEDGYLPNEYFTTIMGCLSKQWDSSTFSSGTYTSQEYQEYLRSDHWRKTRSEAIALAGGKCMICGRTDNLQVHHKTYANLGREYEWDLVVLCDECHNRVHYVKEQIKNRKKNITSVADKWKEDAYRDIEDRKKKIRARYVEMRNKEVSENQGIIDAIAQSYCDYLGDRTIKKNLPSIGSMIGETCGIQGQGPAITKEIASILRNK